MSFFPLHVLFLTFAAVALTTALSAEPAPVALLSRFDTDGDHQLNPVERKAARAYLSEHPVTPAAPPPRRPGEPPPDIPTLEPAKAGAKLSPTDVSISPDQPLFDEASLRTVFIDFEDADWEQSLADFAPTDIPLPARVQLDEKILPPAHAHFLSGSADALSPIGYKRSLELAFDAPFRDGERRLQLFDLRNDSTLIRAALFYHIAAAFGPTPRATFVRVVINGEFRGIYLSVQPFDEPFVAQHFPTTRGARFTLPRGATLAYLGDAPEPYRQVYQLDTPEDPAAWTRLIELCRTLDRTPPEELSTALAPLLDVEGALKLLGIENALMNQSGYRQTGGGYGLYLDPDGRFHLVPLVAESVFQLAESREQVERPRDEPSGGGERGERTGGSGRRSKRGGGDSRGPETASAPSADREKELLSHALKAREFPKQAGTDLAMLLSYSFVNKADHNDDEKLSQDEWLEFAHSWFFMIDEEHGGVATRAQFLSSFRNLITPPSTRDQRSTQTFGGEDPPAILGGDFYSAVDRNSDGRLTEPEFTEAFSSWFTAWRQGKHTWLTRDDIQRGLGTVFSRTVFQADQSRIKRLESVDTGASDRREAGGPGAGGSPVNAGVSLGPIPLGFGRGGGSGRGPRGGGRETAVSYEQWLPLDVLGEKDRPLLTKLLVIPSLRARYVRTIRYVVEDWLTWERLGPIARQYHALIAEDVKTETHKPWSYIRFVQDLDQDTAATDDQNHPASVKAFVLARKETLSKQDGIR